MRLAPALFLPAVLALAACSSPVPATSDAAWTFKTTGGGSCNLANSERQFGDVGSPADSTVPGPVTDGSPVCTSPDGYTTCPMSLPIPTGSPTAKVDCNVWQAGSGFGVYATAYVGTDSLTINLDSLTRGATKASPAVGSVSYESAATSTVTYASSACSFYFASGDEGVDSGKVWVAFTCDPGIVKANGMGETCAVTESYAAFENCATSQR